MGGEGVRTREAPGRIGQAASKEIKLANGSDAPTRERKRGSGPGGPNSPLPFALAPRPPSPLPTASLRAAGNGPGPHPPASSPGVCVATARVSTRVRRQVCASGIGGRRWAVSRRWHKRGARASWDSRFGGRAVHRCRRMRVGACRVWVDLGRRRESGVGSSGDGCLDGFAGGSGQNCRVVRSWRRGQAGRGPAETGR